MEKDLKSLKVSKDFTIRIINEEPVDEIKLNEIVGGSECICDSTSEFCICNKTFLHCDCFGSNTSCQTNKG